MSNVILNGKYKQYWVSLDICCSICCTWTCMFKWLTQREIGRSSFRTWHSIFVTKHTKSVSKKKTSKRGSLVFWRGKWIWIGFLCLHGESKMLPRGKESSIDHVTKRTSINARRLLQRHLIWKEDNRRKGRKAVPTKWTLHEQLAGSMTRFFMALASTEWCGL